MARDQDCSHIENCHSLSVLIQGGHLGQPRVTMAGSKGLAELSALCTRSFSELIMRPSSNTTIQLEGG